MKSEVMNYCELAQTDLKVAMLILNASNDELMQNVAAYHTEQALEKIMKALIINNGGKPIKTHSIIELSNVMKDMNIEVPIWIDEYDYIITSWSTTTRYNTNFKADHDILERVIKLIGEWIKKLKN